jgi:hypothetical protein
MIVRGSDGLRREVFARFDSSTPIPRPSEWGGGLSDAGVRVGFEDAVGLPAFMRGVRLISETAAGLPWLLFRGFGDLRRPQPAASQLGLLRRPESGYAVGVRGVAVHLRFVDRRERVPVETEGPRAAQVSVPGQSVVRDPEIRRGPPDFRAEGPGVRAGGADGR